MRATAGRTPEPVPISLCPEDGVTAPLMSAVGKWTHANVRARENCAASSVSRFHSVDETSVCGFWTTRAFCFGEP